MTHTSLISRDERDRSVRSSTALRIPQRFLCPISGKIMENPVRLMDDDVSYERDALLDWFKHNPLMNPITEEIVSRSDFVADSELKYLIDEFLQRREMISPGLLNYPDLRLSMGMHHVRRKMLNKNGVWTRSKPNVNSSYSVIL